MKKIGILGGTFNPPHLGHIHAATAARRELGLDRVIFIPTSVPPHKRLAEGSPDARDRLRMAALAAEEAGCEVCDIEVRRSGKSYTADTLCRLRLAYPQDELWLIVGTDMFLTIQNWARPEVIFENASIAVISRSVEPQSSLLSHARFLREKYRAKTELICAEVLSVSSSELRCDIKSDMAKSLIPSSVYAYINERALYRECAFPNRATPAAVKARLSEKRFEHTMGTLKTARELAMCWGADVYLAEQAALLHDITREYTAAKNLAICREHGITGISDCPEALLHSISGSIIACEEFGANREVCDAIRWHTTGRAAMSLLEKVIWLADYIEPGRTHPGVDEVRALAFSNLNRALICGFGQSLIYLIKNGKTIGTQMTEAFNWEILHQ